MNEPSGRSKIGGEQGVVLDLNISSTAGCKMQAVVQSTTFTRWPPCRREDFARDIFGLDNQTNTHQSLLDSGFTNYGTHLG
jgi:hypothetical protein